MNAPRFRSTLPGAATLWAFSLALVLLAGAAFAGEPAALPAEPSPAAVSLYKVEDYFREAKEDFLKKDLPKAAAAIRKAESAIRGHIPKAARGARKVLELSADDLKELAPRVEKGLARSAEDLAPAFARAHHALARYHHDAAQRLRARGGPTGRVLEEIAAAGRSLRDGAVWAHYEVKDDLQAVGQKAKRVAEDLKRIAREIREFGKRIKPAKAVK